MSRIAFKFGSFGVALMGWTTITVAAFALIAGAGLATIAAGETLAPTSGTQGKDLHVTDMRNMPFCEIEVLAGFPPMFNFENTTGASDFPPDKFDAINSRRSRRRSGPSGSCSIRGGVG